MNIRDHCDSLVRRNRKYIFNVAKRYKNIIEPDDLTQKVCYALWVYLSNLEDSIASTIDDKAFRKLSFVITKNIVSTELSHRQRSFEKNFIGLNNVSVHGCEKHIISDDEWKNWIDYMNKNLKGKTRLIFNLFVSVFFNKMKLNRKDVGDILGITLPSLAYHINKIREKTYEFYRNL